MTNTGQNFQWLRAPVKKAIIRPGRNTAKGRPGSRQQPRASSTGDAEDSLGIYPAVRVLAIAPKSVKSSGTTLNNRN